MAHVAKAMPAAHLLVQACQHVWLVLDDGACANVHICWSYPSIPSASPHSCSQVRPCLTARLTGYPGGYIVPRASHRAVASSACPGRERLMEQPVSSSHFFLLKQRFMRLLVARFASSRLRRLAPVGLPSFPRSARLTPPARLPASGLRASLAVRFGTQGWPLPCPAVFPDFITLSATVARGHVPSRRARPCPRCAAGRTNLALVSLTAPVHGPPFVAGDELRKDGGNRANRVPRADRTEQPKGWAPNLGIRCAV